MNTLMYEHPLTAEHLKIVREVIRYQIVGPIGKALACGDVGEDRTTYMQMTCPLTFTYLMQPGIGAMTEWREIVQIVVDRYQLIRKTH